MKSTTLITTFVLIGILTGPSLGFEKLARAVNNLFSGNSEQKLGRCPISYFAYLPVFLGKFEAKLLFIFFNKLYVAASSSLKCYESVNNGLGDEVICKDSTSASILGDGDGPFKCATVTTS